MTNQSELIAANLQRRYRKEKFFFAAGLLSVIFASVCLLVLLADITGKGTGALRATYLQLEVTFDSEELGVQQPTAGQQLDAEAIHGADYAAVLKSAIYQRLDVTKRKDKRAAAGLWSIGAEYELRDYLKEHPEQLGKTVKLWLLADDETDTYVKYYYGTGEQYGRVKGKREQWLNQLIDNGDMTTRFNTRFFTNGDSREPELAGIRGALMGSALTLMVTLLLSFPIGIAAALYLEEFAPKNRWTALLEININNLAAVPSIVFGLLGAAVFIAFLGMPRSIPLVGGLVLTLMTLPTIIIASRAAIKAVPPSIREAALGMGASKMQVVLHHVLPLAMPGMLTGLVLGMAQALGETAPLLMIGMVAFIVDIPSTLTDPAAVLPVQIFLWADSPERAFTERTSGAIIVLLFFLVLMNAFGVWARKKLERRW
ncbi:phosphate ABC transporter membrane protein 2 (PhoT family) [Sinobacterium caligoides]|uniref:Phosphate transport system permease protein PstA n=1 Tax=Sinobacterium caligoides TaxID=933926 RepID=A0A3N2E123_9GAMM|nr:phosphate ABC transporter permease PstA [Sinobacterium caligoides]ROS05339.1 phosphate ABC transporter membrane protein 2 (PhoT family) [Sinobacterium caligoides]